MLRTSWLQLKSRITWVTSFHLIYGLFHMSIYYIQMFSQLKVKFPLWRLPYQKDEACTSEHNLLEIPLSCFEGVAWNVFSPLMVPILKHHIIFCHIFFRLKGTTSTPAVELLRPGERPNRPFARSGFMVQNHTRKWVSCTVGLPKRCNSYQSTWTCPCFGSPNAQLAHQHVWFCTMHRASRPQNHISNHKMYAYRIPSLGACDYPIFLSRRFYRPIYF